MVVSAKLGVALRDVNARRQEEYVGQVASANTRCYSESWDEEVNELDVCEYADETEEEDTAMYDDEETNLIMESVFGDYNDEDCNEDITS